MPARPDVFLDTVALLAMVNRADALHARAADLYQKLTADQVPLITSDWVLTEFLGSSSRQPLREPACRMITRLRGSRRVTVIQATRQAWDEAFTFYSSRPDKDWSLVDCTSMLICKELGIQSVFTADRHFIQAGLQALLAP